MRQRIISVSYTHLFNNLAANGVISGDEIRLFVGRILQYGYRGTISTSWRSQNEEAANSIAQAYATQPVSYTHLRRAALPDNEVLRWCK